MHQYYISKFGTISDVGSGIEMYNNYLFCIACDFEKNMNYHFGSAIHTFASYSILNETDTRNTETQLDGAVHWLFIILFW